MVKLSLDCGEVGEDISVVEFQVVDGQRTWAVVNKFGTAIEVRRVVLIRLDDEERFLAETRRAVEVLGHAADEITGVEPGALQDPGHHTGGRGLAVRTRHGNHPAVRQHVCTQPLGTGHVAQPAVEDVFDRLVASGKPRVADDHEIGFWIQVAGVETLERVYLRLRELIAHRRIQGVVRP